MTGKVLGKIRSATFGINDVDMLGVTFDLAGESWACGEFWGEVPKFINVSFGKIALRIRKLLLAAKKDSIEELAGTPIEAEFDGNLLKSWRVLTEVV